MSDATTAGKRLRRDFIKIDKDPPPGISAQPNDDNILEWDAMISGPGDTPFEGGNFKLKLVFPNDYPQKSPTVWFYSKMFHPNVYPDGRICLDILEDEDKWSSDYDVGAVLCGVQSLLGDPNPGSPANGDATELFLKKPNEYAERAEIMSALSNADVDDDTVNQNQMEAEDANLRDFDYAMSLQLGLND